jgi:hypothetical protein
MNAPFDIANIVAPKIKRLNEKALIVQLKTGRPRTSRRDKVAEEYIQREFGDDSLTARSRIFKNKHNPVNMVLQEVNAIYNWHFDQTWSSGDKGDRILSIKALDEYRRTIHDMIEKLNRMKADMLPHYDACVQQDINERTEYARAMGKASTVDISEYPSAAEFDDRTYVAIRLLPLPERSHFLFDVDEADIAGIDGYLQEIEQAVRVSTVKRLLEPVGKLIEKISKPTEETKRFHDSMVTNVIDAVEAFKKVGVDDDPQLAAAVRELDDVVKAHSTGALRDSDVARQQAKQKLEAVASKMAAFM